MNQIINLAFLAVSLIGVSYAAGGELTSHAGDGAKGECVVLAEALGRTSASDDFPLGAQIPVLNMGVIKNGHIALTMIVAKEWQANQIVTWVGKNASVLPARTAQKNAPDGERYRVQILLEGSHRYARVKILESLMQSPDLVPTNAAESGIGELTYEALRTIGVVK